MSSPIDPEGSETTVIHELVDFSGADVLEVGCGDGRLTWRYAEEAATVLAMDMNAEKIASYCGLIQLRSSQRRVLWWRISPRSSFPRTPTTWPSLPLFLMH